MRDFWNTGKNLPNEIMKPVKLTLGNYTLVVTGRYYNLDSQKDEVIELRLPLRVTTTSSIQEGDTLPIVRISDRDYLETEIIPVFHKIAENSALANRTVDWALSNRQSFIDTAVKRAEKLGLDGGNLQKILTKLIFHVDELNFTGKNVITDKEGKKVEVSFRISNATVQLPCLIEKAEYKGMDAWIIALNWEYSLGKMSHVATVVFKYGSDEVLFAASCL